MTTDTTAADVTLVTCAGFFPDHPKRQTKQSLTLMLIPGQETGIATATGYNGATHVYRLATKWDSQAPTITGLVTL